MENEKRLVLKLKANDLKFLESLISDVLEQNTDAVYTAAMNDLRLKLVQLTNAQYLNHRINQTFTFYLCLAETAIFQYLLTFDYPYNYILKQQLENDYTTQPTTPRATKTNGFKRPKR